jgi:hypothetical protein
MVASLIECSIFNAIAPPSRLFSDVENVYIRNKITSDDELFTRTEF